MPEEGFRVATAYVALLVDEGDIEGQIEETITAACQAAGQDGGTVLTREIASKVDDVGPEVSAPLVDALAGAGDAATSEIAATLVEGISVAGEQAGADLAASIESATSGVGEVAGEQLAAELTASTATVGEVMAEQISEHLRVGLDEAASAAMSTLGRINAVGLGGTVASSAAGAGMLSGLAGSLAAAGSDAAAEAGGIVGAEFSRNVTEAAVASMTDAQFEAFTAQLIETASAAGAEAGVAAGDSLSASLSTSLTGVDLIAQGLSTVGDAMSGTAAAMSAGADEIQAAEERTLSGTAAYEAELDAKFEAILRGGQGMSVQLAAAMVEAFQGIEADTEGFSAAELAIFTEFYQTLEAKGEQAAQALAEQLRLVSQQAVSGTDFMAAGQSSYGKPMPDNTALESELGGVQKASTAATYAIGDFGAAEEGATAAAGGMAAMMGGPWLWGILGAVSILPMFSGLLNSNSQAAQAAALAQQQLGQAVAQDSDMVGANTVATITNQLATSGAADTLAGYGISLSQATAAMAGNKDAQSDINGQLDAQITNLQALIQEQEAHTQSTDDQINKEKQQVEQLQLTKDAMGQLEQDVVDAVTKQNELTQATLYAEQAVNVFNVQVQAGVLALKQQATQADVSATATALYMATLMPGTQAYTNAVIDQEVALAHNALTAQINATALNDSLAPQAQLSGAAVTAATDYQQASTATGQYTTALNALYGQYGTTSGAQAAFTTALDGLQGTITSGTNAVDLNTQAGAKNVTAFEGVASAAETAAEKIYQQTGSSQAADLALQDMAGKLDTAAGKAHLTKDQVHELNIELFGVPDVKDIHIHLDPTEAEVEMSALDSFIAGEINSINNTPITPKVGSALGYGMKPNATGGPVQAGVPVITGDGGRAEVFVPNADGRIYPTVDEGARAIAQQGGGRGVTINFYGTQYPTVEQTADMYRQLSAAIGAAA